MQLKSESDVLEGCTHSAVEMITQRDQLRPCNASRGAKGQGPNLEHYGCCGCCKVLWEQLCLDPAKHLPLHHNIAA